MITLNNWWSPFKYWTPGAANSNLIRTEKAVPIIPAKTAKIKYKVPMSLAFVENNQRAMYIYSLVPLYNKCTVSIYYYIKIENFNKPPIFRYKERDLMYSPFQDSNLNPIS